MNLTIILLFICLTTHMMTKRNPDEGRETLTQTYLDACFSPVNTEQR